MYTKLGWKKSPFIKSTSIDIPILGRMNEYEEVSESIDGWDRIIVITAPIGYGKTTFMNQMVMTPPKGVNYVIPFNAYEPPATVIERIRAKLPLHKRIFLKADRTTFGEALQGRLSGEKMLLVFDEAQDYDVELYKWLRILNDRTDNVFMIFLGLPGLEDRITAETSFRDRKSRSIRLKSFEVEDLEEIVRERIIWAGGKGTAPFTADGLRRLCESANSVPRHLLENGQKVVEECALRDMDSVDADFVENVIGGETEIPKTGGDDSVSETSSEDVTGVSHRHDLAEPGVSEPSKTSYHLMDELSPTQQAIVNLLMDRESLSVSELSSSLKKDIRSVGSLIRKLRGLNPMEVSRKPNVPYPIIVRKGKEARMGRLQYVYSLSDNARRILARK